MAAPVYAVTKKISLDITYLRDDQVCISYYSYEVETDNTEQMAKAKENLRLIVDDIYKQLNDKSSEYIYIQEPILILNKKDFLNCNVVVKDVTE